MACEFLHIPLAIPVEPGLHVRMDNDDVPFIQIFTRYSPGETLILGVQGLSIVQMEEALALYAARHNTSVGTILGVTVQGAIFTPTKNWQRGQNTEPTPVRIVTWNEMRALLDIKE